MVLNLKNRVIWQTFNKSKVSMQKCPSGKTKPTELQVTLSRCNGEHSLPLPFLCLDMTKMRPLTHLCDADPQRAPEAMRGTVWDFPSHWLHGTIYKLDSGKNNISYCLLTLDMFGSELARKPTFCILVASTDWIGVGVRGCGLSVKLGPWLSGT